MKKIVIAIAVTLGALTAAYLVPATNQAAACQLDVDC